MNKVDKLLEEIKEHEKTIYDLKTKSALEFYVSPKNDEAIAKAININRGLIARCEEKIGDIIAGEDHEEDAGHIISISLPLQFGIPSGDCDGDTGVKYDSAKCDWSLLPMDAIEEVAEVLTFGAKKYAPDNWKRVPKWRDRYYSAAQRHIKQYRDGEFNDLETDRSHLAHAIACLVFLYEKEKEGA